MNALFLACLLFFVALSHQYGTILVDNVNPAKQTSTYIQYPSSTDAVTIGFNAGTINVADPHGLTANIPTDLTIQGQTANFTGELGSTISAETQATVSTLSFS